METIEELMVTPQLIKRIKWFFLILIKAHGLGNFCNFFLLICLSTYLFIYLSTEKKASFSRCFFSQLSPTKTQGIEKGIIIITFSPKKSIFLCSALGFIPFIGSKRSNSNPRNLIWNRVLVARTGNRP